MAQLAIKGHETRGKEVIEILEMLGGSNKYHFRGDEDEWFMLNGNIQRSDLLFDEKGFTLEEFLEKYPYKVGDKVSSKYLKNYEISMMEWDNFHNRVSYKLKGFGWCSADELQPYKEDIVEERNNDSWAKWDLPDGYEFQDKEGNVINTDTIKLVKKQSQYQKTYEECCDILGTNPIYNNPNLCICKWYPETREVREYYHKLANLSQKDIAFLVLRICRDAYWKIAGEQMGLGQPWEPNWNNDSQFKYIISCRRDKIIKDTNTAKNSILAFPTEKIRDAFYDNFKDMIEECKTFL